MAWDSSRPVPWQRLMREWVIYAGIMAVVFFVLFRDGNLTGAIAGLFISGPLYLTVGAVLAKFGYQRKTMKDMREERTQREAERASTSASTASSSTTRKKPPPTRRTQQGSNRPAGAKRKRR